MRQRIRADAPDEQLVSALSGEGIDELRALVAAELPRPSIDVLFESAAESYKDRAIGVLLTGANEDGACGMREIARRGGRTIVQDPATAQDLKAWYRQLCKRPCFHDEYLQAYNEPGAHLVEAVAPLLGQGVGHGTGPQQRLLDEGGQILARQLFSLAVEPDGDYRFVSVNQAFLDATGLAERQVVGRLVREVIPQPSLDLVRQWHFEVWNEPNLHGWFWGGTQADFHRLWQTTFRAIKSVDASLRVDEALQVERLAGAALDVFEHEPLPLESPLLKMDHVLLAPHNSNSSPAAWERVHWNTIRNLLEGLGLEYELEYQ